MVKPPEIVKVYIDTDTNILYSDVGMANLQEQGFVLSSGTVVDGALLHSSLAALDEDDHTQYSLADGSRSFSGNVSVSAVAPLSGTHVTRKDYVDAAVLAASGVGGVESINTLTGLLTMVGVGETSLSSTGAVITISGSPHVDTTSALVGSDGITVISGASFDTIEGFYAEFVSASGSLQSGGLALAALLSEEIDTDIQTHSEVTSAHHSRYTDGEAVSALGSTLADYTLVDGTKPFTGDVTIDPGFDLITSGTISLADGAADQPSLTFAGDSNTGLYQNSDGVLTVTANGNRTWEFRNSDTLALKILLGVNGSAVGPSFSFWNDVNTGIYRVGADVLGITASGITRLAVSGTEATAGVGINGNLTVAGISTFGDLVNLPQFSSDPGSINDGDIWINSTTSGIRWQVDGQKFEIEGTEV